MTDTKWTDLSTPDPEFKAFIDATTVKLPALAELAGPAGMPGLRAALAAVPKPVVPGVTAPASMDGVEKSRITIPVRDGASVGAVVYRPSGGSGSGGGRPLVVALHGGGWCIGVPEMEEVNCVNAVQKHGAVAVSVDYRLAPEHPFPTPVNDCWDALKWIAANATTPAIAADPTKGFVVHGESAGGNMATVCALLARDERLQPPLTGVSASIPAVLPPGGGDALPERYRKEYLSYAQNKDGPGLNGEAIAFFVGHYNPDHASPLFAPFNWPTGHKGLPPFFIQVCGLDTLRDEALLFERLLRTECGVKTKLVVYPGLPHSFWGFFPHLEVSRKAVGEVVEGFGWLLGEKA